MAKALLGIAFSLLLVTSASLAETNKNNPSWSQLTAEQQKILAPIQGEWNKLEPMRKRKWLGIAQRYPKMKPEEQERLQKRMREWATLTPEQRRAARDKYREFELLPQDERQAMRDKWDQYKQERATQEPSKPQEAAPVTPVSRTIAGEKPPAVSPNQ